MNRFHRELIRDRFDELMDHITAVEDILENGCPSGITIRASDGLHNAAIRAFEALGMDVETFQRCVVPEISRRAAEHREKVARRNKTIGIFERSAAADAFEAVERERRDERIKRYRESERAAAMNRLEAMRRDLELLRELEGAQP